MGVFVQDLRYAVRKLVGAPGTLLRDNAPAVHINAYGVSEGCFEMFGLPMTLGRAFTAEEHKALPQLVAGAGWLIQSFARLRNPGVTAVASTTSVPLRRGVDGSVRTQFKGDAPDPNRPNTARMRMVTPGFLEAMGVPLDKGRDFGPDDRGNTLPVTLVNREFVKRYLSGRDPLTTSLAYGFPNVDTTRFYTIVGVIGDIRMCSG